jgi:hypothetical protein
MLCCVLLSFLLSAVTGTCTPSLRIFKFPAALFVGVFSPLLRHNLNSYYMQSYFFTTGINVKGCQINPSEHKGISNTNPLLLGGR